MVPQTTDHILIWDSAAPPPSDNCTKLIWRGFTEVNSVNETYITALVEKNAEHYRSQYLAWIYELGNTTIDGRKLTEHLELRSEFSYWWMTSLAQKANYMKSPYITDIIRLFAFADFAKNNPNIKSIILASASDELSMCIKGWCDTRNIKFSSEKLVEEVEHKSFLRKLYNGAPCHIQAFFWLLKYLIYHWPLRGVGIKSWKENESSISFISYFANLKPDSAKEGRFESYYWSKLPSALQEKKIHTSWLHLYTESSIAENPRAAAKIIENLNEFQRGRQAHVFLDSFLNFRSVASTVKDYLKIRRILRSRGAEFLKGEISKGEFNGLQLEPFIKKGWEEGFKGVQSMQNLLTLNLFEIAFSGIAKRHAGVYLQENQEWELTMIYAWRKNSHGPLTGFPHSCVRFWDLRYYYDPRSYCKSRLSLPLPDSVAVGGEAIKKTYINAGYPIEDLKDVEALRYIYLNKVNVENSGPVSRSVRRNRLLVLGDYSFSITSMQMNILKMISHRLSNIEITVKPHPLCPIREDDYSELEFQITNKPLIDLLKCSDIAYTSSTTASSLEAYISGLAIISFLDPNSLNLSPMRGIKRVKFVSSADGLEKALSEALLERGNCNYKHSFFNTDPELLGWFSLLHSNVESK